MTKAVFLGGKIKRCGSDWNGSLSAEGRRSLENEAAAETRTTQTDVIRVRCVS